VCNTSVSPVEAGIYGLSVICAVIRVEHNKQFAVGGNDLNTLVITTDRKDIRVL
jgi:hypothetical protein